jgi:glycosyltransferase involved in cell wall biosynthesis
MKIQISAVVITFNEEKNIERCLRSLQGIADEVLVIDSFSKDKTAEISQSLGAKVVQNVFEGYSAQKNFGNNLAQHSWILSLDADEEISPELRQSLLQVKAHCTADAYKFNRCIFYLGKWIRHGNSYPDCKVRLWDKKKGQWGGGSVHEILQMQANASEQKIAGDLYHYSYASVAAQAAQHSKYAALAAADMYAAGKRTSWKNLVINPLSNFVKGYLLKRGFLDGKQGFAMSMMFAYGVFLKYLKCYELEKCNEPTP